MPVRYKDVYDPRNEGLIGRYDTLLKVVHCAWCAVGYEDEVNPVGAILSHHKSRHQDIERNNWEYYYQRKEQQKMVAGVVSRSFRR